MYACDAGGCGGQQRELDLLELQLGVAVRHLMVCWELSLDPLQQQFGLLAPSQPHGGKSETKKLPQDSYPHILEPSLTHGGL